MKDVDGGVEASEVSDNEELAVVEEMDLAECFDVSYEKRNGLRYDVSEGMHRYYRVYMLVRARHQSGGGRGAGMGWRMVVEGEGEARVRYFGDQVFRKVEFGVGTPSPLGQGIRAMMLSRVVGCFSQWLSTVLQLSCYNFFVHM